MKKIAFIFIALAFYIESTKAQCIPASAATVFGTFTATASSNDIFNNVPTGNVIEISVTVPTVKLTVDLCGTNPGAGPFPSGTNDSYVTILSENGPNAIDIDDVDDGCSNIAQPGYGPGFGDVILNQGTYYLYLTEYDAQGTTECISNGSNSNYIIALTSETVATATNDNCTAPIALTVGTVTNATTIGATVEVVVEGVGNNQTSDLCITAPCNPSNGFPVHNLIWFSFNVATAGNYEFAVTPNTSADWGMDFAFFPQADVSCTDITQTVFTNAICKTASINTLDRFIVNLATGNYLIPMSTYSSDENYEFTIEVNAVSVAPSCSDLEAGSVVVAPLCIESNGTINVDFTPPFNAYPIGYVSGFLEIVSQQQITDFSARLGNITSLLSSTDFNDFQLPAADFLQNSPAGVYYYYIVAVGDANYENDTLKGNPNCIEVASTTFEVKAPGEACLVNTKNLKPATELMIFPNPANSQIQIATEIASGAAYDIINTQGKVVLAGTLQDSKVIDVNTLSSGLYILSIKNGEALPSIKHFSIAK